MMSLLFFCSNDTDHGVTFVIIIFVVDDEFFVKIIHYTKYIFFIIKNISFMLTENIIVLVL